MYVSDKTILQNRNCMWYMIITVSIWLYVYSTCNTRNYILPIYNSPR